MSHGINRESALALLQQHIVGPSLLKHCLATEAVMRRLAVHFGEDQEKWGLAGLLHDLDAESHPDLAEHTHHTVELLRGRGVEEDIVEAIRLHNEQAHDERRATRLQHALAAGETITGLIIATALVYPDRKLASVKPKSVRKRMKEKQFAAGANREIIMECEQIGMSIADFCDLCLGAMQEISDELEL